MKHSGRESVALIASWLLLFQLFAPRAFTGNDLTLICGEQGVQEVSFDGEGNPVELPKLNKHCKLCVLSLAVLTDETSISQDHANALGSTLLEKRFLLSPTAKGYASRAPPTFS